MNVGKILSGSQLLQKTEQLGFSTTARERSINEPFSEQTDPEVINGAYKEENNKKQVQNTVDALNEFLEPTHTGLKFELHDKLEKYYVTVIDTDTKEIIKEIPPKKLLDVYAAMAEFMGFIVDEKI
ncbi:flagellar protein FlaG [Sediminibacillus halophilus]|uniref:Flagellar protein FlaG n=1 Tax=Sediminibacillus halophilus TaxID=482461 RepID=A0A1G9RBW3_9BACI|nr:flagellar protein FlaG [Sediminibacillus halophilus]SDM20580.1 flagellar protein FlaG [Sediminibacillus halophilus]